METKKITHNETVTTGVMGTRKDIVIPCQGKRIVNIDFRSKSSAVSYSIPGVPVDLGKLVGGRGNAYISDQELPDITVHLWADLYTEVFFDLTVEVDI